MIRLVEASGNVDFGVIDQDYVSEVWGGAREHAAEVEVEEVVFDVYVSAHRVSVYVHGTLYCYANLEDAELVIGDGVYADSAHISKGAASVDSEASGKVAVSRIGDGYTMTIIHNGSRITLRWKAK